MDCLGPSMDPYFERAIHGLSKHKMTHRGGIGAGNECPFLIGARCRCFAEEDTTNFIF